MFSERKIIEKCIREDLRAQQEFYDFFSKKMFGICLRYAGNFHEAEDILQECFIKIFARLKEYQFQGSLEGWIRRIVINTSIDFYKKGINKVQEISSGFLTYSESDDFNISDEISAKELIKMLQFLPDVYRIVFNLHAIEGYCHHEISKLIGIPENTSKSYLQRSRKLLQEKIAEMNKIAFNEYAGQKSKI